MWIQKEVQIGNKQRGFHIITEEILNNLPEIFEIKVGTLHIFIKHTSASLTVNENSDSTVREDFESHFNNSIPENAEYYTHTFEGPDDIPAHLKSSVLGSSVTIPVSTGKLNLGTWQGIYLCEHRDHGGLRTIILTLNGE